MKKTLPRALEFPSRRHFVRFYSCLFLLLRTPRVFLFGCFFSDGPRPGVFPFIRGVFCAFPATTTIFVGCEF